MPERILGGALTDVQLGTDRRVPTLWNEQLSKTNSNLSSYELSGHLLLKNYIEPPLINDLKKISYELEQNANQFESTLFEPLKQDVVRSIFNLHNIHPFIHKFLVNGPLASLAKEILNSDIRIHQSHFNFKKAEVGGEFGWHSDYTYWHYEDGMPTPRALSMFIFLDEVDKDNGPLEYIPGSHKTWVERDWFHSKSHKELMIHNDDVPDFVPNGHFSQKEVQWMKEKYGPSQLATGSPGDIFIMDGNLLHASGPNLSHKNRCIFAVVYNSTKNALKFIPLERRRPNYLTDRTGQESFDQ